MLSGYKYISPLLRHIVASLFTSSFIHLSTNCTKARDINRTKIKKFLRKLISTPRLLPPNIKAALIDQQKTTYKVFSEPRKISITAPHERPRAKSIMHSDPKATAWNANDTAIKMGLPILSFTIQSMIWIFRSWNWNRLEGRIG